MEVVFDTSARKLAQKDLDATWTKKNSKSYHGYKNHIKMDAGSKLIDHYVVTTACVNDGTMAWELLDERDQGQDLYADKGYAWEDVKEGVALAKMNDRIHKKACKGRPLNEQDKLHNTELSRTRARVEHVFGSMNKQLHGLSVRCIGLARATFQVGLTNLCYNILRSLHLIPGSSVGVV